MELIVVSNKTFCITGKKRKKIVEWVFGKAFCIGCVCQSLSRVLLLVTPWAGACQAPLSRGFPRQEYWSGLPRPPPGDLPDPGIERRSLVCPALAAGFFTTEPPTGVYFHCSYNKLEKWHLNNRVCHQFVTGKDQEGQNFCKPLISHYPYLKGLLPSLIIRK